VEDGEVSWASLIFVFPLLYLRRYSGKTKISCLSPGHLPILHVKETKYARVLTHHDVAVFSLPHSRRHSRLSRFSRHRTPSHLRRPSTRPDRRPGREPGSSHRSRFGQRASLWAFPRIHHHRRRNLLNDPLKKEKIPQEAIIGITYAVSSAVLILILSHSAEGDEHIKQALVGNILLVSWPEVIKITVIYTLVGMVHYIFRKQFFLISQNPSQAFEKGLNVKWWDFLFYVTFGCVVTSSVKIAGVLLVFSFLVVPPVCAMLFAQNLKMRLLLGWLVGFFVSTIGITLSYFLDLPTGACVVATFGAVLILFSCAKYALNKKTVIV
jgi:hypothetical protein